MQSQQDAQLGQGSFFDFDGGGGAGGPAQPDLPVPELPTRARTSTCGRRRRSACSCRATRSRRCGPALRAKVDCSLADLGRQEGRRVGHRRRHDRRVQADPHQEGRPDDVRHPRRPRGTGRDARLQLRLRGQRRQGRLDASCSCAAAWTTRRRVRSSSSRRRSRRSSPRTRRSLRAAEQAAAEPIVQRLTVHVSPGVPAGFLDELKEVVGHHPGEHELLLASASAGSLLGERVPRVGRQQLPGGARRSSWRRAHRGLTRQLYTGRVPPLPCTRRPPSCTSAGSAARSATASCTRAAASRRAASSSTCTTTRRPAGASWAA